MTARHPLAPYGLEDRPPLWDTEEPDGTCRRCGEDVTTCLELGCDYRQRVAELEAVVYDLQERLVHERERADRAEARASVAGWSA